MKYTDADYIEALKFILNYPVEVEFIGYDNDKDVFRVNVLDYGWYMDIPINGSVVRKALKWENKKLVEDYYE